MYILGIHLGHDSSASLMHNGEVLGALQEERFTRIKNYSVTLVFTRVIT